MVSLVFFALLSLGVGLVGVAGYLILKMWRL